MVQDCLFCKIAAGEIPSCTLYENETFRVILDRFPSQVGHTLIIPKKHVEDIFTMDSELAGQLFQLAVPVSKALQIACNAKGLNVLQNNGAIAGQTVFHFHLHLIPRFDGDSVKIGWDTTQPSLEALESISKKIRSNL